MCACVCVNSPNNSVHTYTSTHGQNTKAASAINKSAQFCKAFV